MLPASRPSVLSASDVSVASGESDAPPARWSSEAPAHRSALPRTCRRHSRRLTLVAGAMAAALSLGVAAAPAAAAAVPATAAVSAATSISTAVSTTAVSAAAAVRLGQTTALRCFDRDLLAYINRARAAHHLRALAERPELVVIANSWAAHLASGTVTATFRHNPSLGTTLLASMPGITAYGENIASFTTGSSAYSVLKAYLASPAHRANILSPAFRFVGIVTHAGPHGTSFNAIDFAG